MYKPYLIATFSAPSPTGCWHFYTDQAENLKISWLENQRKGIKMSEGSAEKILEVLDRLGDHIADAIDIAVKAKDALPDGELSSDDKKRLVDGVYQLIKKVVLALEKAKGPQDPKIPEEPKP